MPFNQSVKKRIVCDRTTGEPLPCVMCGTSYPLPDAVHIIDEKEWKTRLGQDSMVNGIPLCPDCHRVFDEILRPYLFRALAKFGCNDLPETWKHNNKLTVTDKHLEIKEEGSD